MKLTGNPGRPITFPADPPVAAPSAPIVFIADADTETRETLAGISRAMGWRSRELPSAGILLSQPEEAVPSCLVLDVSTPWYGDLQLQERLAAERAGIPVICVTGLVDVVMTVRIMKMGAVDVLPKPVRPDLLVEAIRQGLARSAASLRERMALSSLLESYASLSSREREVMNLVASGLLNKQVAGELGISEITVKAHRGRVMRKMSARSFADLVKMADRLKLAEMAGEC